MPHKNGTNHLSSVDITIATRPNDLEALPGLLRDINASVDLVVLGKTVDRDDLLSKCRALVQALETPRETMINHIWAQIGVISAITFGVDCGLWRLMARDGDKTYRVADLAAELGVDAALLCRLMRHLASMRILNEVGKEEYRGTNYTKSLSIPAIGYGYLSNIPWLSAGGLKFNEYSRHHGWKSPTDATDTPLMHAYDMKMDVFTWLKSRGYDSYFNQYLGGYNLGRLPWMDPGVYPVRERLIEGATADANAVFLVDIGGNIGHDMIRFRRYFPDAPGRLILQDLPAVISQTKGLDERIEAMDYDFLTEQPIKGARAYLIHSCMHNWPDVVCEKMLARVKQAMKPGYSKLLLYELVIAEVGAHWEDTALDMVVMTYCASQERTAKAWHNLIEKRAGLKIVRIWNGGKGMESLIECELP
ncbi:hypothetical protein CDD82_7764 [Ophiocordyceps australis]|uniref:O-methyltransferase C-terminal domain-containing protein n=1 Tax=Ophiocordyceps australis TaxID=1399860 RepID=A0A2C5ZPU0_9HYPO|nr:hypothetical protein CDD82_7764 [Ophiocordyceps australis]